MEQIVYWYIMFIQWETQSSFLVADTRLCPSIYLSVCWSIGLSVMIELRCILLSLVKFFWYKFSGWLSVDLSGWLWLTLFGCIFLVVFIWLYFSGCIFLVVFFWLYFSGVSAALLGLLLQNHLLVHFLNEIAALYDCCCVNPPLNPCLIAPTILIYLP